MLWLLRFAALVGEFIDAGDADRLKVPAAALDVLVGVVVGDVRHTHDDAVGHAVVTQEPLQVVEHALVVLAGVTPVDIGVNVLDVNEVLVHEGQQSLQVPAVYIQGSFHRKMPLSRCDMTKRLNELAADGRFSTTKGDSAARGKEVEVVDHHLAKQFCWCNRPRETISPQALGIQAILAA